MVGGLDLGLPMIIHLPLTILSGMLAGGLYGLLAGLLKAKFGASEFIVTLMLNYVATFLCSYLANGPLREEGSLMAQTKTVLPSAQLPELVGGKNLTIALILGIFAVRRHPSVFKQNGAGVRNPRRRTQPDCI